jgi:hypothetical protein
MPFKHLRSPRINAAVEAQAIRASEAKERLAIPLNSIFYFASIHFTL